MGLIWNPPPVVTPNYDVEIEFEEGKGPVGTSGEAITINAYVHPISSAADIDWFSAPVHNCVLKVMDAGGNVTTITTDLLPQYDEKHGGMKYVFHQNAIRRRRYRYFAQATSDAWEDSGPTKHPARKFNSHAVEKSWPILMDVSATAAEPASSTTEITITGAISPFAPKPDPVINPWPYGMPTPEPLPSPADPLPPAPNPGPNLPNGGVDITVLINKISPPPVTLTATFTVNGQTFTYTFTGDPNASYSVPMLDENGNVVMYVNIDPPYSVTP